MANELRLSLGQTGQTVTGRLYQAAVQVGADFPLLEVAGQGGFYTGNMPAVGAGSYDVLFFANGVLRGSGNLAWSGTAELDFSTVNGSGGATAVQIRQELDTNSVKLANLDATVSSRLAAAGYTAPTIPPTAASIRAELDTNSTRLANLDATVSSRLAASGYVAAPTVVQVRQELDTNSVKLANLDATVSSRLSAAGYTAPTIPPTVALIRAELDTNSTRLANLDATISSRLAASGYVPAPTVVQVRQELDTNSVRLQGVVNSSDLSAATSVVLAAVGSPLQSSDYVPACSADAIASATATVLFVDGTTNRLKVNPDHSVNSSGAVGGAITNYITIPAAVAIASQSPAVITSIRGDTLRIELPLMGDLRGRTRCIMTAKRNLTDTDAQAVLQVIEGTGLTCLNGAAATSTDLAQLVITDEITGAATLVIEAPATAKLNVGDLVWDVQAMRATGIVTPISGMLTVIADVTQTIT